MGMNQFKYLSPKQLSAPWNGEKFKTSSTKICTVSAHIVANS